MQGSSSSSSSFSCEGSSKTVSLRRPRLSDASAKACTGVFDGARVAPEEGLEDERLSSASDAPGEGRRERGHAMAVPQVEVAAGAAADGTTGGPKRSIEKTTGEAGEGACGVSSSSSADSAREKSSSMKPQREEAEQGSRFVSHESASRPRGGEGHWMVERKGFSLSALARHGRWGTAFSFIQGRLLSRSLCPLADETPPIEGRGEEEEDDR